MPNRKIRQPYLECLAALSVSCLLPLAVQADDWLQWRGPNRDNVWSEARVLKTFPAGGLKLRWRAPVGYGYSSPITAQGQVYATDSQLERPNARERILCFEETTGKALWTYSHEVNFPDWAFTPDQEKGPNSTPIVRDGKEAWKALDESAAHSTPIIITAGGKRQLIVGTQQSVTALDPATGRIVWREPLPTGADILVSTPVFSNDRLLVGGLLFKLDADKSGASVLWPETRAPSRRIFSNTSTALLRSEYVFSAKSSGELICLDANTGTQVWETNRVTDLKNGASIHLTENGDSVLLFNDRGKLIRGRLTAEGYQEISRAALIEPTYPFAGRKVAWTPPVFANRHVFARAEKELICASLEME